MWLSVSPGIDMTVEFWPGSKRIAESCRLLLAAPPRVVIARVSRSEEVRPRVDNTMIMVGTIP